MMTRLVVDGMVWNTNSFGDQSHRPLAMGPTQKLLVSGVFEPET